MATLKRSVTVDAEVLERLRPERRSNLSAAVNEGLQLLAALDGQQEAIDLFEAERGEIAPDELEPYLEAVVRAQATAAMLRRPRTRSRAGTH